MRHALLGSGTGTSEIPKGGDEEYVRDERRPLPPRMHNTGNVPVTFGPWSGAAQWYNRACEMRPGHNRPWSTASPLRRRLLSVSLFVRQLPALERLTYTDIGARVAGDDDHPTGTEDKKSRVRQEWLRDDILDIVRAPLLSHLCLRGLSVLSRQTRQAITDAASQRTILNPTNLPLKIEF